MTKQDHIAGLLLNGLHPAVIADMHGYHPAYVRVVKQRVFGNRTERERLASAARTRAADREAGRKAYKAARNRGASVGKAHAEYWRAACAADGVQEAYREAWSASKEGC